MKDDFKWIEDCNPYHPFVDVDCWATSQGPRERAYQLKHNKTLIVTESFKPSTIRGYRLEVVYTTKELWEKHGDEICPALYPNLESIIFYELPF